MSEKCKICERDTGGFEYCNEFCEIQGLRSQLEDAREALSSIRGILPTVHSSDREIHEIINKVLKEQG